MKASRATLSSMALFALAGCATMQVRTDYDTEASLGQLRTYTWIDRDADPDGDPAVNSPLLGRHIQDAVEGELGRMGYRQVTSGSPDFRIAYSVTAEERSRIDGSYGYAGSYAYPRYFYPGYFGFRFYSGRRFGPYYGYPGAGYPSTGRVREYLRGTLVLDVIDARTDEVVFRGWARKSLHLDPRPENVRMYVNEAVEKILEDFPPAGSAAGHLVTGS